VFDSESSPHSSIAISLRPYQVDAIDKARALIASGVRRIVIVAPTGAGKTTIAGQIVASAVARGRRALFVAHRRELIQQAYRRLLAFGLAETEVGVVMAGERRCRRPGARVQVASIATLRNRPKPLADLVFVDECHLAMAKSYRALQEHYRAAVHLGLTATPYRGDGQGLEHAYDEMVVVATPRQLIDDGYLVEPRVLTIPPDAMPDLSKVRIRRGDYDERALARIMDQRRLVGNLVEHWLAHAAERRTVAFASSVAHSQHIAARFRDAGVAAEHIDGKTRAKERDAILARLQSGETRVVSNCGVLCEGWDQPSVKCAILARPTKSTGLYLQQAGRILRPWQNMSALILDHAGCALEHGVPQADRTFSLDAGPLRTHAPRSGDVAADGSEPVEREAPDETPETLVELSGDRAAMYEAYDRLCTTARERHYRIGWAYFRFVEQFGHAPPADIVALVRGFSLPRAPETRQPRRRTELATITEVLQRACADNGGRVAWTMFDER